MLFKNVKAHQVQARDHVLWTDGTHVRVLRVLRVTTTADDRGNAETVCLRLLDDRDECDWFEVVLKAGEDVICTGRS